MPRHVGHSDRIGVRLLPIYQGRTQLHMLANALSAVGALLHRRPETAEALLAEIGGWLQRAAGPTAPLVPVAEELRLALTFLGLQRARLGGRLRLEVALAPEALPVLIPAGALQPLIENAIVHGAAQRVIGGRVRVSGRVARGTLHLVVADNGPGVRRPLRIAPRHGWGLAGVRLRLAALWGARARVRLMGRPGAGTIAAISVPALPARARP
jgi:LytS/YehU family sensor histidine kinase